MTWIICCCKAFDKKRGRLFPDPICKNCVITYITTYFRLSVCYNNFGSFKLQLVIPKLKVEVAFRLPAQPENRMVCTCGFLIFNQVKQMLLIFFRPIKSFLRNHITGWPHHCNNTFALIQIIYFHIYFFAWLYFWNVIRFC